MAPALPRHYAVTSADNLQEVLAGAAQRSIVVLSDDGPYLLGGRGWSNRAPALSADIDLTKTPVKGRYVRFYSKGNTSDDQNHYTEVEIYGFEGK